MKLRLVKLNENYKTRLFDMMDEWYAAREKIIPYAISKCNYRDWGMFLESIEVKCESNDWIPDSTYFCLDEERNIFVGAVNIRHYLNNFLLRNGGHIGYGIRPSERNKGYATKMLALTLCECKKIGLSKVLIVCDKNNIGSAKAITNNGGILESEIEEKGGVIQRYWISIQ